MCIALYTRQLPLLRKRFSGETILWLDNENTAKQGWLIRNKKLSAILISSALLNCCSGLMEEEDSLWSDPDFFRNQDFFKGPDFPSSVFFVFCWFCFVFLICLSDLFWAFKRKIVISEEECSEKSHNLSFFSFSYFPTGPDIFLVARLLCQLGTRKKKCRNTDAEADNKKSWSVNFSKKTVNFQWILKNVFESSPST